MAVAEAEAEAEAEDTGRRQPTVQATAVRRVRTRCCRSVLMGTELSRGEGGRAAASSVCRMRLSARAVTR
ncbi:hypothetical protein GCM10010282_71870 [Streptomyces roseolus]|nr:hypothetical protein GCM10010282_71870 [Streptomyces roseolus]